MKYSLSYCYIYWYIFQTHPLYRLINLSILTQFRWFVESSMAGFYYKIVIKSKPSLFILYSLVDQESQIDLWSLVPHPLESILLNRFQNSIVRIEGELDSLPPSQGIWPLTLFQYPDRWFSQNSSAIALVFAKTLNCSFKKPILNRTTQQNR